MESEVQGLSVQTSNAALYSNAAPGSLIGYRKNGAPIYAIGGGSQPSFEDEGGGIGGSNSGFGGNTDSGSSPAYSSYLERFPEDQRALAETVFKEWDGNVTRMTQGIHSQYQQQLEPWASVLGEYSPQDVQQAIAYATALRDDPQGTIQQLMKAFDYQAEQQGQQGQQENEDDPYAGRFSQLEEAIGTLAEALLGNQEQYQQQQEDAELDGLIEDLVNHFQGNIDQGGIDWILQRTVQYGGDVERAVNDYQQWIDSLTSGSNRPAPRLLSPNGGFPSDRIDPTKLDDKGAKDLVAQLISEANRQ